MSQAPITIYVGAGNLDTPHYSFFLDQDGSNELTNFTLDANYTYTFKRLADAASHPFFIRENGSEEALSDQVIINGDGDLINGITGDQSFTLSFADPSIAESLSLEFYCTSHAEMVQTIEIENIQARSIPVINSSKYISGNGEFTLDGLHLGNLNSSEEIGISEILVANETGESHILKPEYVKQKITRGLSGSRGSGSFSGFIKEDGSAVIFNDEDKSYVLEGDAVDIYGNTYLLAVEQRDGSVKTLIKDGNGNLRHHATLTPDNSDAEITSISLSRNSLINTYSDGTIKWNNQTWIVGTPPNSVLNGEDIVKIIPHDSHHIALHNDGTLTRWGHRVTEQKTLPNIPDLDGSDESRTVVDIGNQGGLWIKLEDNSFIYYPGFLGVDNFSSQYNGNWFDDSNQLIPFLDHPANANYDWNGPNDDLFVSRTWGVHHNGGSGLLVERSDGFLVEYSPRGTTDRVISSDWGNDDKGDPISLVDVYHGFIFHLSDGSIRNSRTGDIYYQPTSENDPQPVDVAGIYKRSILLDDGTIVGNNPYPGDIDGPNDDLTVQKIIWTGGYNGDNNTAALRSDGSVITWGSRSNLLIENASESIASSLQSGIKDIFIGGLGAWYAIDSNNQVIPWGHSGSIDNSILTNVSDYPYYTADQSKRNQIKHNEAGTNLIAGLSSDDQSKLSNGQWTVISASLYSQHGDEFEYDAGTDFVDTTDNFLERTFFKPLDRTELDVAIEAWINDEATAIQTYGDINTWDVSDITNFRRLFRNKNTFNSDISKWDVSSGTDFSWMFQGANKFNGDITNWDVSNAIEFSGMFHGATEFNQEIGGWNVGSGKFFRSMFQGARDFNADISQWDVSNGMRFGSMFHGAREFIQEIGGWDVGNGWDFGGMFRETKNFQSDISGWEMSNAQYLRDMFHHSNFNQDIGNWDVSSVTHFEAMFAGSEFNQDIGDWDVSSGIHFAHMFQNNKMFNQDIGNWDVSSANYMWYLFYGADSFNQDIGNWDVSNVKNFWRMFLGTDLFNQDLSRWDVGNGDNFNEMFRGARLFDQDLSGWNIKESATLDNMFDRASKMLDRGWPETPTNSPFGPPPPEFLSQDDAGVVEKSATSSIVYRALANHSSDVKYSIEGESRSLFDIDESTGEVKFLGQAKFDRDNHENNKRSFVVRAMDEFGNFADKLVDFTVEDSSLAFWKDSGYRVDSIDKSAALPTTTAITLKDKNNRVLSDRLSRSWNGVGVMKSNDGYRMLQIGERGRRRGQYRIAELNGDGVLQSVGGWRNKDQAVVDGYEELFELDLNNDGRAGVPTAIDVDADGFVDGLGHYRLMANGSSIDLKDQRGRVLSSRSSRLWNAVDATPKPADPGSGFEVLLAGVRGRRRNRYQVLSTDANGQVTSRSRWLDGQGMAQEGYEGTFQKDFNGDELIGTPTGPSLVDADGNGLVDGITHYALVKGSGDTAEAIDLKSRRGRVLSDATSRGWNVIQSNDTGSGFEILVKGERGRRRSQYQLWEADDAGLITDQSRWLSGRQLADDGYETTFGADLNGNGFVGV